MFVVRRITPHLYKRVTTKTSENEKDFFHTFEFKSVPASLIGFLGALLTVLLVKKILQPKEEEKDKLEKGEL
ncbi:hypothetical protein RRG08_064409 [Elysia crispata]|uniref:Uncharacterized protein n=1 Tax=Elysia crispata TaxID=231223 RepID=A0AAE1D8Y5_9GAST|nr:hypothetical protein RRG08_064409 [Elysia crispata]